MLGVMPNCLWLKVNNNMAEIIIYSKAFCPYCDRAKQLLEHKGLDYTEYRVDLDPEHYQTMLAKSDGRRTLPQIFIDGRGIGGFDDLWALEQQGQLDLLINS